MTGVSWAQIVWEDGTPVSQTFDDIYFSRQDGLEESLHTFLQGIDAPHIWQKKDSFTLFETGFGTGLNFLASVEMWLKTANRSSRLHFFSVEAYPLSYQNLVKAHAIWPDLHDHAKELQGIWLPKTSGLHTFSMFDNRVKLNLFITPLDKAIIKAKNMLPPASVHAWYLDGFAPSKNPDMWTQALYQTMATLSHTGAQVASFTVAGAVQRGLQKAGFCVRKRPGFRHKRDSLSAHFPGQTL